MLRCFGIYGVCVRYALCIVECKLKKRCISVYEEYGLCIAEYELRTLAYVRLTYISYLDML